MVLSFMSYDQPMDMYLILKFIKGKMFKKQVIQKSIIGLYLYTNNYYKSVNLLNLLYKQITYTTGILRSNKKNNHTSIVNTLNMKKGDYCFAKKGSV